MSDYTPTTEEHIRAQFTFGITGDARTRQIERCSRLLAEIKAQAWEEGITAFDVAITKDVDDPWSQLPDNPYRQQQD